MNFIFASPDQTDKEGLLQGDLLIRNKPLKDAIQAAHAYYAEAPDYSHFMVLTQSCDLVRRASAPRSRYITLAAARPLSVVVERFTKQYQFKVEFPLPVCDKKNEIRAKQLLERLIHNTQDGYFFIRKDSHPDISEDLCVFLNLSIALRIEHYDACLTAKVAQLDNIFSAKVGWLTGNLYSRIGTPDVEERLPNSEQYKKDFYEEALFAKTAWLSNQQFKILKQKIGDWEKANPGLNLDSETAKSILNAIPADPTIAVDRAITLLKKNGLLANDDQERIAKNVLQNDVFLTRLASPQ